MADSTVRVVFLGDAKQLRSALKDVDSDTDKLEKTAKKTEAGFGNLKTALIGLGIGAGLKAVIGEASDLNETVSKTRTIFGDASDEIMAFGDNAASSIGLSRTEALNAVSTFGNLFDQLGVGSDIAARMSTEMVTLAADFASFHNADTVEVTEAMTSAFRGEYDALQRFVPTINAAAVEQEALAMSGKETTKELTAQEKALAVNSLMMKNAGDAAGDFSRTSDSLANKQRILGAEFKNMQAELGQRLMPIATQVVGVLTDMVSAFSSLPAPLQNTILGLGGAAGAFVLVGKSVDSLTRAKDAVVPAFEKVRSVLVKTGDDGEKSMTKLGKSASVAMGVVAVGAAAYMASRITDSMNTIKLNIDRLTGATEQDMDRIVKSMLAVIPTAERWGTSTKIMTEFQDQFRVVAETSIDTAMRLRDAMAANGQETEYYDGVIQEVIASTNRKEEADKRSKDVLDQAKDSTEKKSKADEKADEELKKLVDTLVMYEGELRDADSAINDLMSSTHAIDDADAEWNESLRNLTESVKENGREVNTWTEAGNKNREAINGVIEAGGKWLAQIYETEGASSRFQGAQGQIRQSLIDTMTELGFSKEEIARYVDEWNKVPSYIETNVAIKYRISTIKELMDEMDKTGYFADGGVVNTPFQIVGERGPELVSLPMGSRVFSNTDSQRMMSGGGGQSVVVNFYYPKFTSPSDSHLVANQVSRELAVALRGSVN